MPTRTERLRTRRHMLMTKGGRLTESEQYWLDYLNYVLELSDQPSEAAE